MFPFQSTLTTSQAGKVLGTIWLLSLGTALPILIVQIEEIPGDSASNLSLPYCLERWFDDPQANNHAQFIFSLVSFILQYLFPLVVIIFTYTSIWIRIWYQTDYLGENNRLATNQTRILARKVSLISLGILNMTELISFSLFS